MAKKRMTGEYYIADGFSRKEKKIVVPHLDRTAVPGPKNKKKRRKGGNLERNGLAGAHHREPTCQLDTNAKTRGARRVCLARATNGREILVVLGLFCFARRAQFRSLLGSGHGPRGLPPKAS